MEASREVFWNIAIGPPLLYTLAIVAVGILIYVIYRRRRLWMVGKPDNRFDNLSKRIRDFIVTAVAEGLFHRRFLRSPYSGIMHFLIFAGCGLLLLGSFLDFLSHYFLHFIHGNVYLGLGLATDIGGVFVLIGVIMAAVRRYIQKPERLNSILDDAIVLVLIFVVLITGFFLEGFRLVAATPEGLSQPEFYSHPEWARWSFAGYSIASLFAGSTEGTRIAWYGGLWWLHSVLSMGVIIYVSLSFSKLLHLLTAPVNVFFRTSRPKGALAPADLEETHALGVSKIEDFTWKQLLDLDACTNCGRCQDECPAYLTGKPLSPKKVIQDLKAHLVDKSGILLGARQADSGSVDRTLIGEAVAEDELWACTTCRACQEACPVFVEHIDKMVDMRRWLVDSGLVFGSVTQCLESLVLLGNPWKFPQSERTEWSVNLSLKSISDDFTPEIIYWVGCSGAYDPKGQEIAKAMVHLLNAAGVNYAVLGSKEKCCGDPARRLGEEGLFHRLAMENIAVLRRYGAAKVLTHCPHCYNTLKNEYPQLGGEFEVIHHTEFLTEVIKDGKLKVRDFECQVTFHDPCYLGRYNDIYRAPRQTLQAIPKLQLAEMEHNRAKALCCGGGGGHMWIENISGTRINYYRFEEADKTSAEIVVTACPFCKVMLDDACSYKGLSEKVRVKDVAELIQSCLQS